MADGLPEGFPSGYALDLAERAKACELLLKTTAQVLRTGMAGRPSPPRPSPTSSVRTRAGRQGSHESAVQTSAADREQRWSKAPGSKGENLSHRKSAQ
ncbi:hypothetical protein MRX96_027606 [Rhipicephalus microplus]